MLAISIIGAGRMGGALALALDHAGYSIDNLVYRRIEPPPGLTTAFHRQPHVCKIDDLRSVSSDIIFVTTQDSEIGVASKQLEDLVQDSPAVFITSGALSSKSIENLKDRGCKTGSIHPLVSISDPITGAEQFTGVYFCVEGDSEAVAIAGSIVECLDGHSFSIPTDKKPLYHAAAVTSSGHLVALIDIAIGMLEKCGLEPTEGKKVLLPLVESTLDNLKEQALEASLTGTFARGDVETFNSHVTAIERDGSKDLLEIYLALAARSVEIAERAGRGSSSLDELKERVLIAKRELR